MQQEEEPLSSRRASDSQISPPPCSWRQGDRTSWPISPGLGSQVPGQCRREGFCVCRVNDSLGARLVVQPLDEAVEPGLVLLKNGWNGQRKWVLVLAQ